MVEKRGRGRPPQHPTPPPKTNELNNSNQNNYLSLSENLVDGDNGGNGDGRGKKKNNQKCGCWLCHDVTHIIEGEIQSLQKSLSHTKQDTNKILDEIKKLKEYFLK